MNHWPTGTFNPNAPDPAEDWRREQTFEIPDEDERDEERDWAGMEVKESRE